MKAPRRPVGPAAAASNRQSRKVALALLAACITAMGSVSGRAVEPCTPAAGRIASVQGKVEVSTNDGSVWRMAVLNEAVCVGNLVRVGENSRALVALANQSILRVNERTTLRLMA